MAECSICDGTGWMPIEIEGVRSVKPCVCKTRARAEAEKHLPGGFQPLREIISDRTRMLDAVLVGEARRVASIIESRSGQENAVTIRDLIEKIWPFDLQDAKLFNLRAREIKATVERMRRFGGIPVAASKTDPAGYFIPSTAEEAEAMYLRHRAELVAHARIMQLFKPGADIVRELEGQLQLVAR